MRLVLYASCLFFYCTLFHQALSLSLERKLEKRIDKNTALFKLAESGGFRTITAAEGSYEDNAMFWAKDEDRLISLSQNDLVFSVQSNVGAWICTIHGPTWLKMHSAGLLPDEPSEPAKKLYQELWVNGCRQSLLDKLALWSRVLQNTDNYHEGTPFKVFGAQVFAMALSNKKPAGHKVRRKILSDLKDILQFQYIPMMGWPAFYQADGTVGFVVVQEPVQWSVEEGYYAIVKIYSTGTGPGNFKKDKKTGSDVVNNRRPGWGTHPAIEMKLQGGTSIDDCEDLWIFRSSARLDKNGDMFPDATEYDPVNPYN